MNYETAGEIELRIVKYYGFRQNLIVPNVFWGLLNHEADLLILSKSNYLTEIEIKISKSDLIADLKKSHHHKSNIIKYLYFAIPEKLKEYINYIPEQAGIYIIEQNGKVNKLRNAKENVNLRKLKENEKYNMARLGTMRIWNLTEALSISHESYHYLRKEYDLLKGK